MTAIQLLYILGNKRKNNIQIQKIQKGFQPIDNFINNTRKTLKMRKNFHPRTFILHILLHLLLLLCNESWKTCMNLWRPFRPCNYFQTSKLVYNNEFALFKKYWNLKHRDFKLYSPWWPFHRSWMLRLWLPHGCPGCLCWSDAWHDPGLSHGSQYLPKYNMQPIQWLHWTFFKPV